MGLGQHISSRGERVIRAVFGQPNAPQAAPSADGMDRVIARRPVWRRYGPSHAEYAHRIVNLLDGAIVAENIQKVL